MSDEDFTFSLTYLIFSDDPKVLAKLRSFNEDGKLNVMMLLDTENDQKKAEKAVKKHYGGFQIVGHDEVCTMN